MMKDMIKQNVARNMADKEQIRLYAKSPSGESRMHLKIRMIIIMVCILLFCIGLGIFLILRQSRNRNGTRYSSATIFSDGQLLYFPNEKNTGL